MNSDILKAKRQTKNVINLLSKVESNLKSARNWGLYDIVGGKTLVGIVKHRKIRNAESNLKKVKRELLTLERDLDRLSLPINSKINPGTIITFMDIFLDFTFADLYTQIKISDALKNVRSLKKDLKSLYNELSNY